MLLSCQGIHPPHVFKVAIWPAEAPRWQDGTRRCRLLRRLPRAEPPCAGCSRFRGVRKARGRPQPVGGAGRRGVGRPSGGGLGEARLWGRPPQPMAASAGGQAGWLRRTRRCFLAFLLRVEATYCIIRSRCLSVSLRFAVSPLSPAAVNGFSTKCSELHVAQPSVVRESIYCLRR